MKIRINYDLLSKIREYKLVFSLQKSLTKVSFCTSFQVAFLASFNVASEIPMFEGMSLTIPLCIISNTLFEFMIINRLSEQRKKIQSA